MEHLNRQLKRLVLGMGANCTVDSIVKVSQCIKKLEEVVNEVDNLLAVPPVQNHHARPLASEDEELIAQLVDKSRVFQYIPGCSHKLYPKITTSILQSISADKFINWLQSHKECT